MAYQREKKRKPVRVGDFPTVTDDEIRRFRSMCKDTDEVIDYAAGLRRLGGKWQSIEDDYELIVTYKKEEHIKSINSDLQVVFPSVCVLGSPVLSAYPQLQVGINGLTTHSGKLSEWVAYLYQPDYTIRDGNDTNSYFIPIPRDEATMSDMRTVLNDMKVPAPITGGLLELFNGKAGIKTFFAGVQTVVSYFKPTQTVIDTVAVAGAVSGY